MTLTAALDPEGRYLAKLLLIATLFFSAQAAEPSGAHAIFKTADGGQSWTRSDKGMPGNSRINAFGSVDNSIFAGTDSGIFISRDAGQNWRASAGLAAASGRIISLASLERDVYAGTDTSGILSSADQGMTWFRNSSFPSSSVRCLLGYQGKLYVGTDAERVFVTSDGGRNWTRLFDGLPEHAQVFTLAMVEGRLFAGLYSKGLYVWNDQEHRWAKTGDISPLVLAPVGNTLVAGHNPGGIHWSDDLGVTWSKATASSSNKFLLPEPDLFAELASDAPVWELASNKTMVFAGASSGIYYSEDRGRTWTRARTGLPTGSPGVAFLVQDDIVLAGIVVKRAIDLPAAVSNDHQAIRP